MGTPHKHADLIKAWADGAEIQAVTSWGKWVDVTSTPIWSYDIEYRIKPKTVPYLLFLCRSKNDKGNFFTVSACGEHQIMRAKEDYIHIGAPRHENFIKILHEGVTDGI